MTIRTFAILFGTILLMAGLAGMAPSLLGPIHPEHPRLILSIGYGQLFALFPVNLLHDLIHGLFGLWGLVGARAIGWARVYARCMAILFLALALAGFVPDLSIGFGLLPLFGNDIWLHALLAGISAYFGWLHGDHLRDRAPPAAQ